MSSDRDRDSFRLECSCISRCTILVFDHWLPFKTDPSAWYWEVYTRAGEHRLLRWRLKQAWGILRGRDHYIDTLCFEDEAARTLQEWIAERLKATA